MIPESETFALQVLMDPVHDWRLEREPVVAESPAAEEFDIDDLLSRAWLKRHAAGFIESAVLSETENYPPPAYEDAEAYDTFWEGEQRASGLLEITVTHPGWLAHLQPGMRWESSAFDMGEALPWIKQPRRPDDHVWRVAADPDAGMKAVERTDLTSSYLEAANVEPGFLAPAFGDSYYILDDPINADDITPEVLEQLRLQPVVVRTEGEDIVGTLFSISSDDHIEIFSMGELSCGLSAVARENIVAIGRARFRERIPVGEVN